MAAARRVRREIFLILVCRVLCPREKQREKEKNRTNKKQEDKFSACFYFAEDICIVRMQQIKTSAPAPCNKLNNMPTSKTIKPKDFYVKNMPFTARLLNLGVWAHNLPWYTTSPPKCRPSIQSALGKITKRGMPGQLGLCLRI